MVPKRMRRALFTVAFILWVVSAVQPAQSQAEKTPSPTNSDRSTVPSRPSENLTQSW